MKSFIAPLAVMLLAGIAPLAQANIQITYKVDGFAPVVCFSATDAVTCAEDTGSVTGLKITSLGANSNLTGEPSLALASSSNSILSALTGTGPHNIHIDIVAQGFIMPLAPPALEFKSHIGTTAPVLAAASTLAFHTCVDTNNTLLGCPGAPGVAPYVSATLHPDVATLGSDNRDAPMLIIPVLGSPYALDEQFDITVGASGRMNFTGSSTLTPVPEPMSIALLGGVVLLTSRLIRRKRSEVS